MVCHSEALPIKPPYLATPLCLFTLHRENSIPFEYKYNYVNLNANIQWIRLRSPVISLFVCTCGLIDFILQAKVVTHTLLTAWDVNVVDECCTSCNNKGFPYGIYRHKIALLWIWSLKFPNQRGGRTTLAAIADHAVTMCHTQLTRATVFLWGRLGRRWSGRLSVPASNARTRSHYKKRHFNFLR